MKGHALRAAIAEQVEIGASTLVTDEAKGHQSFSLRDGPTTNQVEAYFGQLKRSIDGTHHHVSRERPAPSAARHASVSASQSDIDRQYDLMKWIVGSFALGMLTVVVSIVTVIRSARRGGPEPSAPA
jgi:hypothetical protein